MFLEDLPSTLSLPCFFFFRVELGSVLTKGLWHDDFGVLPKASCNDIM